MKPTDVDSYIAQSAEFARPILSHLRELVHATVPNIEEAIKWQFPCFIYKGKILCHMAGFKAHCSFGFWLAPLMKDSHGVLEGRGENSAMGQLGKITGLKDLPSDAILKTYLFEAAALIDAGKTLPKKTGQKKQYSMPGAFKSALEKNPKALNAYQKMSPSHQQEYLEYISEAKQEATVQRRIEKTIGLLLKDKELNAEYSRKA